MNNLYYSFLHILQTHNQTKWMIFSLLLSSYCLIVWRWFEEYYSVFIDVTLITHCLCIDAPYSRTFQSFFLLIRFFDHLIRNIRSSSHQEIRKHYCLSSLRLTSSFINTRSDVALMMKREKKSVVVTCLYTSFHKNRVAWIE